MGASSKTVDFANVKEGGNFNKKRIPAGDYLALITKVEDAPSKGDGVFQYLFSVKIVSRPTSVLPYYCKLQENQLWKLRNILIAAGKTVPKKKMKVDVNSLVGKQIGVTIEDAEYEGKDQSEIGGVFPKSELAELDVPADDDEDDEEEDEEEVEDAEVVDDEEEEEEAEEEAEPEAEEEEEEEEEGDEYDAMDRLSLRKVLQGLDKSIKTSTKQSDDDLRDLIRDLESKKAAAAARAAKTTTRKKATKKASEVTDDELEELDIDDL